MKRALILVVVLVALLALASPAFAFNGFRGDYTTTPYCQLCHAGGVGGETYNQWVETKHAQSSADNMAIRSPASHCAGCHTSNYDPGKASPTPTATSYLPAPSSATPSPVPTATVTAYAWANAPNSSAADTGNAASSELFIGCSSCHYGANSGVQYGADLDNTAHQSNVLDMANADICGQCHSRYSYNVDTYGFVQATPTATPTWVQPQYATGFKMLGNLANGFTPELLSNEMVISQPLWVPAPNPTAYPTPSTQLMSYWQVDGADSVWQKLGHDGSAAQYPEWFQGGHKDALTGLTSQSFWAFLTEEVKAGCLECHSTDYRIAEEGDKPTSSEVKYGVTCVGCHTPHDKGNVTGAWDEEFDAQLVGDEKDMCVECHNAEIPAGETATAGSTVHHPMKEMMDGTGAIDVPAGAPSVHKGKCVECHMAPTSYSRGAVQLGGNHTFTIIEPETAVEASPIPISTTTAKATSYPEAGVSRVTTTLTVNQDSMPFSACSSCHNSNIKATPSPVSVSTTTPTPAPAAVQAETVTIKQQVAGGDKGLYLQETLVDRQETTQARIASITAELGDAAARMGYPVGADDAATITTTLAAIAAKPAADRTASDISFQKAYTNRTFVEAEGSSGIHNYPYATAILDKAMQQAKAARTTLAGITCVPNVTALTYGGSVMLSGVVTGGTQPTLVGGQVKLWRQNAGSTVWNVVGSTYLDGDNSDMYEFVVMPSKNAIYKAQFVGNEMYEALVSAPTASVTVAWSVTFKASATKVKKGKSITYSGVVGPTGAAVGKTVIIQKKTSSGWVTWKTVPTLVAADGKWSYKVKMTKVGKLTLRAYVAADATHAEGFSASKTIKTVR